MQVVDLAPILLRQEHALEASGRGGTELGLDLGNPKDSSGLIDLTSCRQKRITCQVLAGNHAADLERKAIEEPSKVSGHSRLQRSPALLVGRERDLPLLPHRRIGTVHRLNARLGRWTHFYAERQTLLLGNNKSTGLEAIRAGNELVGE